MAENSKIEWTDHTFNPWTGCTKVSPGCAHCYAEGWAKRSGIVKWGAGKPRRRTSEANWREPLKWNRDGLACWGRRPRVFCASLADWLDDEVPVAWLIDLFELIRVTPNLDWLLLTKRPQHWKRHVQLALDCCVRQPTHHPVMVGEWIENWWQGKPPENVWVGTTVEDQPRAGERIPELLKIPAAVRFLSCEPLLEPVDIRFGLYRNPEIRVCPKCLFASNREDEFICPNDGAVMRSDIAVDWVICGGESGPKARAFHEAWAMDLREQCKLEGTAFFMKQLGGVRNHRGNLEDFSEVLRVREFPKLEASAW